MKARIAAGLLAISAGSAFAADVLGPVTYRPVPMVAPVINWTGFYIGAMGGYGWSNSVRETVGGLAVSTSSSDLNGGFGGGTAGFNSQTGQVVFGVEADGAWSRIRFSQTVFGVTVSDKLQSFVSVTGRIGYSVGPALIYGKGGYALAENQIFASAFGVAFSESRMHSGWTIGGGLEYLFTPNWSAKAEYMYADYGNATYLQSFGGSGIGLGATVSTVKAGINYHFGWPGSQVVGRYY